LQPFHTNKFPDTDVDEIYKILRKLSTRFNYSTEYNVDSIEAGLFLVSKVKH
jgi:hypothetical protein